MVYRVEHPEHERGPYRSEYGLIHLDDKHSSDTEHHPCPQSDGIGYDWPDGWKFGFRTMIQLGTWFEGFGNDLAGAGMVVRRLLVDEEHIKDGRHQVAFDRDAAKVVSDIDVAYAVRG